MKIILIVLGIKKHKLQDKYITLLDEPLAHPDYTIREGVPDYQKRKFIM